MVGGYWLVVLSRIRRAFTNHQPPTTNPSAGQYVLGPLRPHAVLDANVALFRVAGLADDADAGVARHERVDEIDARRRMVIVLEMELASKAHARLDVAARTHLNRAEPVAHFLEG